jgi:choline dehydrogenase
MILPMACRTRQTDVLIIGAGSAGCAVARRLVDKGDQSVLLVEAGGANRSWKVQIPAAAVRLAGDPEFDWCYQTGPDRSRANRVDQCYRGKGLGGSSSINGMVYVRGASGDFDRWALRGCSGWAWRDVEPVYRELEGNADCSNKKKDGIRVATRVVNRGHKTTKAFMESANVMGLATIEDYNAGEQEGLGFAQLTQRRGFRVSSSKAFLSPISRRRNFSISINTLVLKLVVVAGRVSGALILRDGEIEFIESQRTVLCAGAINTPQILMLSGIGNARELSKLGIEPVLDSPHIGRNLLEHPLVKLVYETNVETFNDAKRPLAAVRHLFEFLCFGEGPLAGVFQAVGFFKSRSELALPDLQLHFLPLALCPGNDGVLKISRRSGVSIYVNLSRPQSVGGVSLESPDPMKAPKIAYNLLENDADVEALVRGMEIIQAIMAQQPIAGLVRNELVPGCDVMALGQAAAVEMVRSSAEPAYHPIGTCAMGIGPSAVVDPRLKFRGLEDLWIADASIMPDLISGNTNAVCMMIGDRLGRWLAERC